MKNWQLTIVAAAAALGLQACDVDVRPPSGQDSASSGQPAAPAAEAQGTSSGGSVASAPPDGASGTAASGATAASPPAAPDAGTNQQGSPLASTPAADPSSPDTGAMGAAPAAGATPAGAAALPAAADGVASPTELARFLEEHPVQPRNKEAASNQPEEGKSNAAKTGARDGTSKPGKS